MRLAPTLLALGLCAATAASAQVVRGGALPAPLPIHPSNHWWNVDITAAPVDTNSASFITFIGATTGAWPDFGGDADPGNPNDPEIYGMVWITVPGSQPRVPVFFSPYGSQSDPGWPGLPSGYPIPPEAINQPRWIEGGYPGNQNQGSDQHMLIVDRDARVLYELWQTRYNTSLARWEAGSGAIFALDSNDRRPDTWTSADAAGLAILPGLVRYDEAFGTEPIRHALRVTVQATNGYVHPASHQAGSTAGALPMGARLRLKASKDITGYAPAVQRIFQAMKTYGLIVADNGSNLYVQGGYDTRWDNGVLNPAFSSLKASDFDVIQLGWKPTSAPLGSSSSFHSLTPCRILDTRNAAGILGAPPLWPGKTRVLPIGGICGVPMGARSVSLNVTVVGAPATGSVTLFGGDAVAPTTTTNSFSVGSTRANNTVINLSTDGTATLSVKLNAAAATHLVVDVNGYFQ